MCLARVAPPVDFPHAFVMLPNRIHPKEAVMSRHYREKMTGARVPEGEDKVRRAQAEQSRNCLAKIAAAEAFKLQACPSSALNITRHSVPTLPAGANNGISPSASTFARTAPARGTSRSRIAHGYGKSQRERKVFPSSTTAAATYHNGTSPAAVFYLRGVCRQNKRPNCLGLLQGLVRYLHHRREI